MPMDARLESGCLGFSVNLVMRPVPSAVMMPKREASSQGTGMTAMVRSASFFLCVASMSA